MLQRRTSPLRSDFIEIYLTGQAEKNKYLSCWLQASLFELPTSLFELRRDKTPRQGARNYKSIVFFTSASSAISAVNPTFLFLFTAEMAEYYITIYMFQFNGFFLQIVLINCLRLEKAHQRNCITPLHPESRAFQMAIIQDRSDILHLCILHPAF
jgi:hypothetical protein